MWYFDDPIPVIGDAPDASPTTCVELSQAWVSVLVGVAEFMLWPGFWVGSVEEVDQAVSHAAQLIGLLVGQECQAVQYAKLFHLSDGPGGSSIVGWQTRVLTHEQDPDSIVSLSSNAFTPIAGKYIVRATAPVFGISLHQLRLWDVTSARAALKGVAGYAFPTAGYRQGSLAFLCGHAEIDGETEFRLEHYCTQALATYGLGLDVDSGEQNQYATVELTRIG